jgi:hypothetical protein
MACLSPVDQSGFSFKLHQARDMAISCQLIGVINVYEPKRGLGKRIDCKSQLSAFLEPVI